VEYEILGCRPGERRWLLVLLVSPKLRLASGACRHPGLLAGSVVPARDGADD
jgi:hypothetical protein